MKIASLFSFAFGLLLASATAASGAEEIVNTLGMKLARIESGEFIMGSGAAPPRTREEWNGRDWDESPAHKVKIGKPFYLGVTEVTNAQYERFDPEHKKLRGKHRVSKTDDEPVVMVTWQQAAEFCTWLAKKE